MYFWIFVVEVAVNKGEGNQNNMDSHYVLPEETQQTEVMLKYHLSAAGLMMAAEQKYERRINCCRQSHIKVKGSLVAVDVHWACRKSYLTLLCPSKAVKIGLHLIFFFLM